jgi:mono/diheme cytochrome c family protein
VLKMTRIAKHVSLAALLGALGACGGGAPPGPLVVPAHLEGPVRSTDVESGEVAFRRVCASCHAGGGAPALADLGLAPGVVRTQVRQGYGKMPAVGTKQLSDDDLEAVLAYMESIGGVRGVPAEPIAPVDDTAGGELEPDAAPEAD